MATLALLESCHKPRNKYVAEEYHGENHPVTQILQESVETESDGDEDEANDNHS